jgi:hypothetical protein
MALAVALGCTRLHAVACRHFAICPRVGATDVIAFENSRLHPVTILQNGDGVCRRKSPPNLLY